jgi:hypothetical protein
MKAGMVAVGLMTSVAVVGCSGRPPGYPAPATSDSGRGAALVATATRDGELGALSARGLVDALAARGFAVPNLVVSTALECPAAGCDQSVVTDTVRVMSFASTARAQKYAGDHGLRQIETIVVEFAPPLFSAERDRYWAEIQSLVR